ncbi:hypothetical protein PLESTB_000624400 [Pleodorina starrii]|uniref:Uncharacterized protein n=1 Tax=Pleodorina starrii TaxID=330485 RepID=A0A9W6F1J6_9CHLO|nr:hypothetical protein PLESTB_000624400 [Pleodorina starrii]
MAKKKKRSSHCQSTPTVDAPPADGPEARAARPALLFLFPTSMPDGAVGERRHGGRPGDCIVGGYGRGGGGRPGDCIVGSSGRGGGGRPSGWKGGRLAARDG